MLFKDDGRGRYCNVAGNIYVVIEGMIEFCQGLCTKSMNGCCRIIFFRAICECSCGWYLCKSVLILIMISCFMDYVVEKMKRVYWSIVE